MDRTVPREAGQLFGPVGEVEHVATCSRPEVEDGVGHHVPLMVEGKYEPFGTSSAEDLVDPGMRGGVGECPW